MTTASLNDRADTGVVEEKPDPAARARRRTFTAEYKARILDEYDALPAGSEQRGALLRREGLYTSHIAEWRKAREAGARKGLAPKGRAKRTPEQVELEKLRRLSSSRPSWTGPSWHWRSREKHTRSWKCSPRARTPTRSRSRDQRAPRRPGSGDLDEAGV
jgi:hypothetical protein